MKNFFVLWLIIWFIIWDKILQKRKIKTMPIYNIKWDEDDFPLSSPNTWYINIP